MRVHRRHVLQQGPVLAALVKTAAAAMRKKRPDGIDLPGPIFKGSAPARPDALVHDYIRHVGGDPKAYRGTVPAHLFPQWGFPLLASQLTDVPYDMRRILNGGCRIEVNRPLPAGERLQLEAQLVDIDDNGRRAVIKQRLITGTESAPDAIVSWMYAIVPLKKSDGPKKEKPRVPGDAREIARWRLKPQDAMDFAILTGDFNPVHWIPAYARAAGFKSTILHGFASFARAAETLNQQVFSGDVSQLKTIDIKFTRPLVLPSEVGVYLGDGGAFSVGDHPGGPAYLTGLFNEETP